jgi:arylsulfatase
MSAKPNFLIIMADDLGFSDLGAFGGEIATPTLDALALRGVRLVDFHTAPVCSPSRAMLMTGQDNHRVGLGTMAELMTPRQPDFLRLAAGHPGYEGHVHPDVVTVAERLEAIGYFTAISGKWHIGWEEAESPKAQGFQRSFVLLDGRQNHFGADQSDLWKEFDADSAYRRDGKLEAFPKGAYSADVFTDQMIDYLDEAPDGKPFFAVMAYTQPHWPLQAPQPLIERQKGRYDSGPADLRQRRIAGMMRAGVAPKDAPAFEPDFQWDSLPAERRAALTRSMEVYAAMVESMDQNVARIVDTLAAKGQLDNTYIIFMSDNGADGTDLVGPVELRGKDVPPELRINNAIDNIGKSDSFIAYGPDWAQAAMAPSRRMKGHVWNGGTHSPAFIAGPGVKPGIAPAFTHLADIPATIVDLASGGAEAIPAEFDGVTLRPLLSNSGAVVRDDSVAVGWEHSYGRALRMGDWKAVFATTNVSWIFPLNDPTVRWRLFDLSSDPGESIDLSTRHPDRLAKMVEAWRAYAKRVGVFIPAPLRTPDDQPH